MKRLLLKGMASIKKMASTKRNGLHDTQTARQPRSQRIFSLFFKNCSGDEGEQHDSNSSHLLHDVVSGDIF